MRWGRCISRMTPPGGVPGLGTDLVLVIRDISKLLTRRPFASSSRIRAGPIGPNAMIGSERRSLLISVKPMTMAPL